MTVDLNSVLVLVQGFVAKKRGKTVALAGETFLFREGLLDSFSIVELTRELGKRFNLTLSSGELIPEDFETPAVLHARLQELADD